MLIHLIWNGLLSMSSALLPNICKERRAAEKPLSQCMYRCDSSFSAALLHARAAIRCSEQGFACRVYGESSCVGRGTAGSFEGAARRGEAVRAAEGESVNGTEICSIVLLPRPPAFVSMQLGTGTPCE